MMITLRSQRVKSLNCFFVWFLVHFWKYRGGFNSVMKAKQYVRENKVGKFNFFTFDCPYFLVWWRLWKKLKFFRNTKYNVSYCQSKKTVSQSTSPFVLPSCKCSWWRPRSPCPRSFVENFVYIKAIWSTQVLISLHWYQCKHNSEFLLFTSLERYSCTLSTGSHCLHPIMGMHILHTVLCTFPEVLIKRICLTIKGFSFPFFLGP